MICLRKVKSFCCDDITKIENYDLAISDSTQVWQCHHRLEFMPFSNKQVGIEYLKQQNLYYNQPASAFIFLTEADHKSLHFTGNSRNLKGRTLKETTKQKISSSLKGIKKDPFSNEHKKRLSDSHKGKHWKLVDGKRIWY